MKRINVIFVIVLTVLAACKNGSKSGTDENGGDSTAVQEASSKDAGIASTSKRYEIKSGKVVYKGPMGVIQTLYFENFGELESFSTEVDLGIAKSKETQIRKEGFQYTFKDEEKTGTKMKWVVNDMKFEKMDTELMKRYKVKDQGKETLAGKECRKFSAEFGSSPMSVWTWNNIMVKTITKMGNNEMVIEATTIEEGPVDPSVFELPADIVFEEI